MGGSLIGTRLANRYEIVSELGRGGMGVVYRARDPLLNRDVAVKLIPPSALTPEAEERFRREAQVVAQMNHPSIVSIFDLGEYDGGLFFLMPLISGNNLRQLLSEHSLRHGEMIEIGIQLAAALDYSHSNGIIHRDIKPENIMIVRERDESIRVCVMDFGLAKAHAEKGITKTGMLVGTVAYLSPEQVSGREPSPSSDIYAIGNLLYECFAGEPPFIGDLQSVCYRIVHELPLSPRSCGVEMSEELESIILRCLAKDPQKRPRSAGEVADSLRRYRSKLQSDEIEKLISTTDGKTLRLTRPALSPFIGREGELARLQNRLNVAVSGECQLVLVGGEAGIGKTRLLAEVEGIARARRIHVLHGRFSEREGAFPYQGFCEIIHDHFRSRDSGAPPASIDSLSDLASDLIALFPVLAEVSEIRSAAFGASRLAPESQRSEDRTVIFELLAKTITRLSGTRPLVLILENLHAAEVSLDALQYIVRRLGLTPMLIAGTFRQTEISKGHPLLRLIDGFSDDPRVETIQLGPLLPSEHASLVESLLGGGKLSRGAAEKLHASTDANPYFTKELIRSLQEGGGLTRDEDGNWKLNVGTVGSDALPATIQQAVQKRIQRLPEAQRTLLSTASVLGRSFEVRDLEAVTKGNSGFDDTLDQLVSDGLLEEERGSRGDRLTFSSGIVCDVLYGELARRKRRSLHRECAEHLEKRYAGRLERIYPQLVHHFSEGDIPEKTVEYGIEHAKRSLGTFSPEEAIGAARKALEFLGDDWSGERSREGEARLLLASAYRMAGNLDLALQEAEAAAESLQILAGATKGARAIDAILLAAETAWQARKIEETGRWVERGIDGARLMNDPVILSRLLALAATVASLRGEHEKAREHLEEAERLEQRDEKRNAEIPDGGRLVVALSSQIAATEPATLQTVEEVEALGNVFEALLSTDDRGNLVPNLCEKWEALEGGRSFVLTLRSGIRFPSGEELEAQHVKASFERLARLRVSHPAVGPLEGAAEYIAGESEGIKGIQVRSTLEVKLQLSEPLPIYPALLTDAVTSIVHVGGREGQEKVEGTGPFFISSSDGDLTLARNDGYWKRRAYLDEVVIRCGLTATAIAAALRSGEIDLARDLRPEDLEEIERDPALKRGITEVARKNTFFALFNTKSDLGRNREMRLSIAGAIRTGDLIARTIGRHAQAAMGLIPPGILAHDAGRRAKKFVTETTRPPQPAGAPPGLRVTAHPAFHDRYRGFTSSLLQAWSSLGIQPAIETTTMDSYQSSKQFNDDYDLIMVRWGADYDDPDDFTHVLFNSANGQLRQYFSSGETDSLAHQARCETDPGTRIELYRRFEDLLIESGIVIPLFHEIDYRIARPDVYGVRLRNSAPYVRYDDIGKQSLENPDQSRVIHRGGTIHVPMAASMEKLDPVIGHTVEGGTVLPMVFESLSRLGEGARMMPWVAADIKAEEGARRFRFRLRDGIRFHDGRRVTARDVRASFERTLADPTNSLQLLLPIQGAQEVHDGRRTDLEGFQIVSSSEFTIDLLFPLSFFPALVGDISCAILPEGTESVSGTWMDGCVGTGAYRIVQFEPGHRLELERNPHYWRDGFPKNERLIFEMGTSPDQIAAGLREGRYTMGTDLYPSDVEALRHDPVFAPGYCEMPMLMSYFILLNTRKGYFADPNRRRDFLAMIDPDAIVRRTLGRQAIPAKGLIPPGLLGYSAVGTRRTPSASPAIRNDSEIDLLAGAHPLFFGPYAALLREITAATEPGHFRLRTVSSMIDASRGDLHVGRWGADYPDADSLIHNLLHSHAGMFRNFYSSPEVDRLAERGRTETDPAVRHAIYRQVEEILARDSVLLPLFYEQNYRFVRPEFEGLSLNMSQPYVAFENLRLRRQPA